MDNHEKYMLEAYKEAKLAYGKGEVPVGAVVVRNGEIIGRGHNIKESEKNPLGHGEIKAILEASRNLDSWRLLDSAIYVTLEPCPMCAGAIINSRIDRVYIGARDYKRGCCGTVTDIINDEISNHRAEIVFGVMGTECERLLKEFFRDLRENKIKSF